MKKISFEDGGSTAMATSFSIARLPRIEFGRGVFSQVAEIAAQYGSRALVVTGAQSFQATPHWEDLQSRFKQRGVVFAVCEVAGEPSPNLIDETVNKHAGESFDVVIGIGGGSALDAAKAIAGLLRVKRSVMDFLEGVGPELPYEGPAVPLIAIPTTAGTGSEATKNAVLSIQARDGFKKSFRHEKLVADYAVVDPALLASCPPDIIAANGMDALTQLIESYVSTRANVFTDALGIRGLLAARDGLLPWFEQGAGAEAAQDNMAFAAMISGINLAQTGLGSVHGLASPLGAFYPIPHGVVCGTLVAVATDMNIQAMRQQEPENPSLGKYAHIAEALCQRQYQSKEHAWEALVALLTQWTERLRLPRLSQYGLVDAELNHVVANARGSSMKSNPIVLTDAQIRAVMERRM